MCGEGLPLVTRKVGPLVVPDDRREAPYTGPGEVTRRSKLVAATVNGRREVVQSVWVWEGQYDSTWAPFCTSHCAARFGLSAFRHVRGGMLPAETARAILPAPAEARPHTLESRYGLLLEAAAAPEAEAAHALYCAEPAPKPVRQARPELPEHWRPAARKYAEGTPGHPLWHPKGQPPPVPGEFRYDAGGYRIPDTPEALAMKRASIARAREARAAKFAEAGKPWGRRQVNGHHHRPPA
jgi:hypothetical protein